MKAIRGVLKYGASASWLWLGLVGASLFLAGCREIAGPPPMGAIDASVSTTGEDIDPDGYSVTVNDSLTRQVGVNASAIFPDLPADDHRVALDGLADNCVLGAPNPRTVTVPNGDTVAVAMEVTCRRREGALEVNVSTSGDDPDPDGYTVTVDGESSMSLAADGSVTFESLGEGDHQVELTGVAGNCTVDGSNPRTVSVPFDDTASTAYEVSCVPRVGDLEIGVRTWGFDLDPDGYSVTVDGGSRRSVSIGGSLLFEGLSEGDHAVELSGVAGNCTVDGSNPRSVRVETGNTVSTQFDVRCRAKPGIVFDTFRDGNREVYLMDPGGSNQTNLTRNPAADWKSDLSPDGRKVAFTSDRNGMTGIYVMNKNGSNVRMIHDGGFGPIWSPDGSKVLFDWKDDIWVMNADGSDVTNLTDNPAWDGLPDWKPDGSKIVFTSDRNGGDFSQGEADVFVMDSDGSNVVQLTSNPGLDANPAWSPDGSRITFSRRPSGEDEEVYIMDANGSNQKNLTNAPGSDEGMSDWLPDGSRILFMSDRDGNSEVYSMEPDGTNQTNLTNSSADDQEPQAGGDP